MPATLSGIFADTVKIILFGHWLEGRGSRVLNFGRKKKGAEGQASLFELLI